MKTFREFLLEYIGGASGVASYGTANIPDKGIAGQESSQSKNVFNYNTFAEKLRGFLGGKKEPLPNNHTVNVDKSGKLDRSVLNINASTPANIINIICEFILAFCLANGVAIGIGNDSPRKLFNINPIFRNKLIQALKDEKIDIQFSV